MKYCSICEAYRDAELEYCGECGHPLDEAPPGAARPPEVPEPAPARAELPPAAPWETDASAFDERPEPPEPEPPPAEAPPPPPPPAHDAAAPAPPDVDPAAREAYREVVDAVDRHLRQGFELFGLVGHSGSGKTHCLKALTYLLDKHGVGSQEARSEFRKAPVPDLTAASVFDYACTGPNGERWVFIDAGGELYMRLRNNDWKTFRDDSAALTHWLHHCRGLFMFLHLDHGHFGKRWIDLDPDLHDEVARSDVDRKVLKAREAQQELEFFRHFLLFLRALKAEHGNVRKVIERCERGPTLEKALRDYHTRAPLLDIPVMFFFTKADTYDEHGFEIADGLHLAPRRLPLATAAFVARHLPYLFASLVSQVRRFKFDFLQSYEEHVTDFKDEQGRPRTETHWQIDGDTLLSVGLLSGLEFVLRHPPGARRWWRRAGLDTRQALLLHRRLNPGEWRGVRVDLGTWRRPPEKTPPEEAPSGEAPPEETPSEETP